MAGRSGLRATWTRSIHILHVCQAQGKIAHAYRLVSPSLSYTATFGKLIPLQPPGYLTSQTVSFNSFILSNFLSLRFHILSSTLDPICFDFIRTTVGPLSTISPARLVLKHFNKHI